MYNYRPTESKIVALGERDIIPPGRNTYELQLTYTFSSKLRASRIYLTVSRNFMFLDHFILVSKSVDIVPSIQWMSRALYESEFESQLWMLYNSHKQLVACGDAYPSNYGLKVTTPQSFITIGISKIS